MKIFRGNGSCRSTCGSTLVILGQNNRLIAWIWYSFFHGERGKGRYKMFKKEAKIKKKKKSPSEKLVDIKKRTFLPDGRPIEVERVSYKTFQLFMITVRDGKIFMYSAITHIIM